MDLVQGNDDVLEEDHVLVSEGHCETRDDTGKNIKKFCSSIEFMCFMNQTEKALIDCFSNHLAARHQLKDRIINLKKIYDIPTRHKFSRSPVIQ